MIKLNLAIKKDLFSTSCFQKPFELQHS